jgi:hypothetical protein
MRRPLDPPKPLDTTNDVRLVGFRHVSCSANGKWIRLVFVDKAKAEHAVQLPADIIEPLLPILSNVLAEAKRKSGTENKRIPFTIRSGAVNLASDGNLVFDFQIPAAAPFSFLMDKDGGRLLLESVRRLQAGLQSFQCRHIGDSSYLKTGHRNHKRLGSH